MLGELIFNDLFFYTVSILALIVPFLVQSVNKAIVIKENWVKQLISWVLAIALTLGFYFGKLLYFAENNGDQHSIWMVVFCGLFVGLISNGIYDIPAIKAFLDKIFNMPKFDKDGNLITKQ